MSVSTAVPLTLLIDKCASSSSTSNNSSSSIVIEQALEPRVQGDNLITCTTTTTAPLKTLSSNSSISAVSVKVPDANDKEEHKQQISNRSSVVINLLKEEKNGDLATSSAEADNEELLVLVRDFGYPESSPLHQGNHLQQQRWSQVSLSSAEFTGRQARALYDFVPETEYEIGMNEGDVVWVQYRQCPGWLIADVHYETGLIPESYVEFI